MSDRHFLGGIPLFAALAPEACAALAERLQPCRVEAGTKVVSEGEAGDRLFLIRRGRAEVSTRLAGEAVPLATLGPGDLFGEIALLQPQAQRQATVIALDELDLLALPRPEFERLLAEQPQLKAAFAAWADQLLLFKFLRVATPFASLDPAQLRELARRVERRPVEAGAVVVAEGEQGDEAFLVHSGRFEVRQTVRGLEQAVATLGPGALFGEAALLTEGARSATVRALEPGELLVLRREDLLAVLRQEPVRFEVVRLLRGRQRPRRCEGVELFRRRTVDGTELTILKDARRGVYHQLSPLGAFVWEHLDGTRNLRDLTLAYFAASKRFAPDALAQVVCGLVDVGLVQAGQLRPDVLPAGAAPDAPVRFGGLAWQRSVEGVDAWLTRLHRAGPRLLFSSAGQAALALLALAGFMIFSARVAAAPALARAPLQALWLLPMLLLGLVWHEAWHAFAIKSFGREVRRLGVGWRGLLPIAFVDTSDMWLSGRWPRVAVSLAGPYGNVVLAGLIGWAAALADPDALWLIGGAMWLQLAMALLNLCPWFVSDGQQALEDWLDGRADRGLRRRLRLVSGVAYSALTLGFAAGVWRWFLA